MLVLFAFSLLWSSLGDLSGSIDMCRVYSIDLFSLQIYARRLVWFLPFSGCLRDHLRTPIISISWVYKICTPPKLNLSSLRYHRCTNLQVLHFQFVRRRQQIANRVEEKWEEGYWKSSLRSSSSSVSLHFPFLLLDQSIHVLCVFRGLLSFWTVWGWSRVRS